MTSSGSLADSLDQSLTSSGDAKAEQFVRELIHSTVEEIYAQSNPMAVYLQGSFARGEGTIQHGGDGKPRLWRDLDVMLIYRTRERNEVLQSIERELESLRGVETVETTVSGGNISLAQMPYLVATRWRDLKTFELAKRGLLLAGADIRERMAVTDGHIPIESAERFMLQKAVGLCLVFPYLNADPFTVNYEVSKLYLEISNAAALHEGAPSVRFEERVDTMRSSSDTSIRDLADRTVRFGRYKLVGDTEALNKEDPAELWSQGREDLRLVLSRIHERIYGERLSLDKHDDLWIYYKGLSKRFLPAMFSTLVGRRWPPSVLQRTIGRFGKNLYSAYSWAALGSKSQILLDCPFSAVYCGALALLSELEPGRPAPQETSTSEEFFQLLGADIELSDSSQWAQDLESLYFDVSKPLYGVA